MNKKLLLGLGSLAAAALPVTVVVACDSKDKKVSPDKSGKPTSPKPPKPPTAKPNLVTEVNKFVDFASTDLITSEVATLPAGDVDVKAQFQKIKRYNAPTLENGATLSKVVVHDALNDDKVVFEVTVSKDKYNAEKNITVTFSKTPLNLQQEINKFVNFTSSDLTSSDTAKLKVGAADVKDQFVAIQGYANPSLATGATLSKVVVKTPLTNKSVVFRVTLLNLDDSSTVSKDVTVTFSKLEPSITINKNAKLVKWKIIVDNSGNFTVSVPNGAYFITAAMVKNIFKGNGTLTVTGPIGGYKPSIPGTYTFTITDTLTIEGQSSTKTATFALTVEEPPKVAIPTIEFNNRASKGQIKDFLTSGLNADIKKYAPLDVSKVTKDHPIGPHSSANFNYAGAIGIMNAINKLAVDASWNSDITAKALANAQAILKALLLDKRVLQNKANAQNLNTQKVAQDFFEELVKDGIDDLANIGVTNNQTIISKVLTYQAGRNTDANLIGHKVKFILTNSDGKISVQLHDGGAQQ